MPASEQVIARQKGKVDAGGCPDGMPDGRTAVWAATKDANDSTLTREGIMKTSGCRSEYCWASEWTSGKTRNE